MCVYCLYCLRKSHHCWPCLGRREAQKRRSSRGPSGMVLNSRHCGFREAGQFIKPLPHGEDTKRNSGAHGDLYPLLTLPLPDSMARKRSAEHLLPSSWRCQDMAVTCFRTSSSRRHSQPAATLQMRRDAQAYVNRPAIGRLDAVESLQEPHCHKRDLCESKLLTYANSYHEAHTQSAAI